MDLPARLFVWAPIAVIDPNPIPANPCKLGDAKAWCSLIKHADWSGIGETRPPEHKRTNHQQFLQKKKSHPALFYYKS